MTAENWLFSLSSSWGMQKITQKSGSHSRQPAGSQGQGILTPPCWPLLLSYSAVTQNAELFIQTDGKTVKKVSQSARDYGGERWDTWTCSTKLLGGKHYLLRHSWPGVLYPCVKRIFLKIQTVPGICILSNTWGSQTWTSCIVSEHLVAKEDRAMLAAYLQFGNSPR